MKRQRESLAQLDLFLSLCQANITEFILVKSTFDVIPLYNNQQDNLYPEATLETVQETSRLAGSLKNYH